MGQFTDQIFTTRLCLDFPTTFESVSEFALGYPVKRVHRDDGCIILNVMYWKRWILYKDIRIRVVSEDDSTCRIGAFGKAGVFPLYLLPLGDLAIYRISRQQFRKELCGYLEPYIRSDDSGVSMTNEAHKEEHL